MSVIELQTTIDKRVEQYIAVRNKIKQLEEAHELVLKPWKELQEQLGGWLQTFLTASGADNIKTKHGTCYLNTRFSATLSEPDVFMDFVIANHAFELLDRRANTTAVKEYTKEHNTLPPGCNLSSIQTVGVRKPT